MIGFWVGVLGNIVAALICGVPAYLHHHHVSTRRHQQVMEAVRQK